MPDAPGQLIEFLVQILSASGLASFVDFDSGAPQAKLDREDELLELLLGEARDHQILRLWTMGRCIVVPRQHAVSPLYESAVCLADRRGWDVAVRSSGGTAVASHEGILNISLMSTERRAMPAIQASYERLIAIISSALEILGLTIDHGRVFGAVCDGSFNLRHDGRKIGGTALTVRRRGNRIGTIAHCAVSVGGDPAMEVREVSCFEAALGRTPAYRISAHTSVEQALLMEWAAPNAATQRRFGTSHERHSTGSAAGAVHHGEAKRRAQTGE